MSTLVRSSKFSFCTADLRQVLLAIISIVTFFTVDANAQASEREDVVVTKFDIKTPQGENAEVIIEVPLQPEGTQAVIADALRAEAKANTSITESDATVGATAQALADAGADPSAPIPNSIFAERTLPYQDGQAPAETKQLEPKDRVQGAIFALVKTGLTSYVYLGISHIPLKSAAIAIATSLVLNLAFDTTHVWSKMLSPFKWGATKLANAFGLNPKKSKGADLFVKTTATFFLSSIFQGIYAGEILGSDFAKLFWSTSTLFTVFTSTLNSLMLSQPWEIAFDNLIESGNTKYSPETLRRIASLRSILGSELSAVSQGGYGWAHYASAGVLVTGVYIMVKSFNVSKQLAAARDAAIRRLTQIFSFQRDHRDKFCVDVLKAPPEKPVRHKSHVNDETFDGAA